MASIQAIEQSSVHQIQSGQVIVDLNSVVKELVENSLDADATSIEVRFRNHGLESIEVIDNGTGIAPDDFESVAKKHHTSKLRSYNDLEDLNTFGFRGEALASLCALSQLHVITAREVDKPRGSRLDFEISGKLKSTNTVAASRGTKVVVEKIFHNLPVRKKELEKNIKREYGKVLTLLQAYACISTGVRFSVSNQMPKGSKMIAFATTSNTTTKDNIINVFGHKTLNALVRLDLRLAMQPTKSNLPTQYDGNSRQVKVEGHISRPVFGEGRQAPDRQMFYVNSRPCGLPQVAKAFNEAYKTFNISQSPFVFANLIMDTNSYDVNVSPDKRTILLHDQGALLETLKEALLELFEAQEQSVPQSKLSTGKLPAYKPLTVVRQSDPEPEENPTQSPTPQISHSSAEDLTETEWVTQRGSPERLIHNWVGRGAQDRVEVATPKTKPPVQNAFDRMRPQRTPQQVAEITIGNTTTKTVIGSGSHTPRRQPKIHTPKTSLAKNLRVFAMSGTQVESGDEQSDQEDEGSEEEGSTYGVDRDDDAQETPQDEQDVEKTQHDEDESLFVPISTPRKIFENLAEVESSPIDQIQSDPRQPEADVPENNENGNGSDAEDLDEDTRRIREDEKVARMIQQAEDDAARPPQRTVKRLAQALRSKHTTLNLTQAHDITTQAIAQQAALLSQIVPSSKQKPDKPNGLTDDITQEDAEARLSLTVTKSDFGQMNIIGQFNLGFVLAMRPPSETTTSSDLFIIDQHAADEKYNFERFTNTLTLEPQRLAQPKQLHLTAIEEEIVMAHASPLTANGFLITVDTSGESPVGQRCKLLALPMSKETTFDLGDLEELLHLLSDYSGGNGNIPRPSKVRKMLAMRACRSSIMVGKTLTRGQMVKVVRNLGEMDKPWNCPHGRPTMRHLADLGAWGLDDEEEEEEVVTDWKGWIKRVREEKMEE